MIFVLRLEGGTGDVFFVAAMAEAANFHPRVVFHLPPRHFSADIQLYDVGVLVDLFRGWSDVFAGEMAPVQSGFVPHPELLFITQHNLRPVWQGKPEIHPDPAFIQGQSSRGSQPRRRDGGIVPAEVVVGTVATARNRRG